MDKCNSCQSERILLTSAKCSDLFSMVYKGKGGHGYVPDNLFFGKDGYGDYSEFDFCLDCGKIPCQTPSLRSANSSTRLATPMVKGREQIGQRLSGYLFLNGSMQSLHLAWPSK